ncbi:hypothetical protein FV227_27785 [Methylobacterium sp. WL119]|uniref:hypothetical protein n=1 Tax=Methylobacterium sp. WL93 TaxID=2603892 RepID=UPI0011C6F344|nr:hypothetical protein [Methylobacterium sp. WL93]TXN43558.1 hypothetical protein FV227_27785 [Methylobacterium sp. WL119]
MTAIVLIDGTNGECLAVKPAYGSPCNGCGWCCATQACSVALEHIPGHPAEGACQALERDGKRFVCGMIRRPGHYMGLPNDWADGVLGDMIAATLGSGKGFDAKF